MATMTFTDMLRTEVAALQAQYPERLGAIARANALIANGHVIPLGDGNAQVLSEHEEGVVYEVNGTCSCPDAVYRNHHCKHQSAWRLFQHVAKKVAAQPEPEPEPAPAPVSGIDPKFITTIQGKPYIQYVGLLAIAHERGLAHLSARIEHHSETLVLASATATFQDGHTFTEWADSTPENTGAKVRPHWVRMALTRAKARCLRDALNIGLVAVEELE